MSNDDQPRAVQISTRLPPQIVRVVEQRARQQHRSVSNYIAALLADHVGQDRAEVA
jgi:hypothetical protein